MNIKLVHTTDGVKTICKSCGIEIMSITHKCNAFKNLIKEKNESPN